MATRPFRRCLLPATLLIAAAACGRGAGGEADAVTGRVMSRTETQYCVSPDRGETSRCVPAAAADGAIEVGRCVRATFPPKASEARLEPVADSACAAGDIGPER